MQLYATPVPLTAIARLIVMAEIAAQTPQDQRMQMHNPASRHSLRHPRPLSRRKAKDMDVRDKRGHDSERVPEVCDLHRFAHARDDDVKSGSGAAQLTAYFVNSA
jgi:hypothetical protein